jgi:ATP-dependent RNA helicase DDX51/DBP6
MEELVFYRSTEFNTFLLLGLNQPWKSIPLTVKWMPAHQVAFQKLLFSATLSQNPETLEKLHLFQPKLFTSVVENQLSSQAKASDINAAATDNDKDMESSDTPSASAPQNISEGFVGKYTTPSELKESFVLCKKTTKPLVLTYLISKLKWKRVLCFTNTTESTHRLCMLLKLMGHLNVKEVSSKWNPKTREMVIKKFTEGSIDM